MLQEGFGGLGTSEGRDHVGRRGKGISEASVLQLGGIGRHYIDTVDDAGPSDIVEDLFAFESVFGQREESVKSSHT